MEGKNGICRGDIYFKIVGVALLGDPQIIFVPCSRGAEDCAPYNVFDKIFLQIQFIIIYHRSFITPIYINNKLSEVLN